MQGFFFGGGGAGFTVYVCVTKLAGNGGRGGGGRGLYLSHQLNGGRGKKLF